MPRPQTPSPAAGHPTGRDRKALGAWSTPADLVELVVARTIEDAWLARLDRPVRVLDPACGDGRFLVAAATRIVELGGRAELTAVDVDPAAVAATTTALAEAGPDADVRCADSLRIAWSDEHFDVVVGNPPFLSQLAARSTRGGSSRHGGGPYADAAAEFLALAVRLTRPGGRVGLVLPQSVLAARDAGAVRAEVDRLTESVWSWWSPERLFDAEVHVCALGFERRPHVSSRLQESPSSRRSAAESGADPVWTDVIAEHLGVPVLPALRTSGTLGDRAGLNANFRDEYYGLVPAVSDHVDGPPLVTTGLIDPGRCHWGERPARFAKRSFDAPRVGLDRLDARMRRWADRKLVPKVLVATQTSVIEAVVDASGAWLPGVPVTSVVPHVDDRGDNRGVDIWEVGAVLTSPVASAWAWHRAAGTGLSARTLRLGPALLADLPWPTGELSAAVAALRAGDVERCGALVTAAYGVEHDDGGAEAIVQAWWLDGVRRLTRPRPTRRGGARGRPVLGEPGPDPASR